MTRCSSAKNKRKSANFCTPSTPPPDHSTLHLVRTFVRSELAQRALPAVYLSKNFIFCRRKPRARPASHHRAPSSSSSSSPPNVVVMLGGGLCSRTLTQIDVPDLKKFSGLHSGRNFGRIQARVWRRRQNNYGHKM